MNTNGDVLTGFKLHVSPVESEHVGRFGEIADTLDSALGNCRRD